MKRKCDGKFCGADAIHILRAASESEDFVSTYFTHRGLVAFACGRHVSALLRAQDCWVVERL